MHSAYYTIIEYLIMHELDIHFAEANTNLRIQSISHKEFAQTHSSLLFDNFPDNETHLDSCSQARNSHSSCSNAGPSSESHGQVLIGSLGAKTTGGAGNKNYGSLSPWMEDPYAASNSSEVVRSIFHS